MRLRKECDGWCESLGGAAPSDEEIRLALEFVTRHDAAVVPDGSLNAWEALAQTLLLSNEFIYVD